MRETIAKGAVAGFVLAVLLIISVFATGQTFGQRCAKMHERGTQQWSDCIDRLADGD